MSKIAFLVFMLFSSTLVAAEYAPNQPAINAKQIVMMALSVRNFISTDEFRSTCNKRDGGRAFVCYVTGESVGKYKVVLDGEDLDFRCIAKFENDGYWGCKI